MRIPSSAGSLVLIHRGLKGVPWVLPCPGSVTPSQLFPCLN